MPVPAAVPPMPRIAQLVARRRGEGAWRGAIAGGVGVELLAERHRHGVLQVRAARLDDVRERVAAFVERVRPARRAAGTARSSSSSVAMRIAVGKTSFVDCAMLT